MCRVGRNILLTASRLNQRGLEVDGKCLTCNAAEDLDHSLLLCPRSKECWDLPGINFSKNAHSFGGLVVSSMHTSDQNWVMKIWWVAWSIWSAHNCFFCQGKWKLAQLILTDAMRTLNEQDAAVVYSRVSQLRRESPRKQGWKKLATGHLKCDVETSVSLRIGSRAMV